MKKQRKDESFLKKPWYEGGNEAMGIFIQRHMKYPDDAIAHKVSGIVKVRIAIDYLGNVVDAKVISGLGYGCDEEAIRIVMKMKFKVQKSPRKLKVTYHNVINIKFKFSEKIKNEDGTDMSNLPLGNRPPVAFTYVYTSTTSKDVVAPIPKKNYSYSIKIDREGY